MAAETGLNGKILQMGGRNRHYLSLILDPFIVDYHDGLRRPVLSDVRRHTILGESLDRVNSMMRMQFPVSDVPEPHTAAEWEGQRIRGLWPGTAYTFYAVAVAPNDILTSLSESGPFRTSLHGDINRSGRVTFLDCLLFHASLPGGIPFPWPCDIDDDRDLDGDDNDALIRAATGR